MLLSAMATGHTKIRGTEAKGPFSSFLVKKMSCLRLELVNGESKMVEEYT